ncbi:MULTISPECIES: protein adenylyltransferase SelO [Methylosinus]|uniref:Protein nucleotidyltransferase YdiU n=1 Tax=Methylosinus trichosporium (strain ATCC 35070 / NCIMB 11131 / UNIQEM 75 / OB3b) TaxID=595536 RepID=A0A2D2CY83_METT3|nr:MULTISPECIES: YdiU family protein [Methylosinus]ATQ67676.1 SELO family protein [Methylosinus trichosporium OB3b]OBS53649.1 selenoprotein O [Methylosinus sp. 3S-1]
MPLSPRYRAAPLHSTLGDEFFDRVQPADFPKHILRHRNQRAAATVGLDTLTDEEWIAFFGRFEPLPENFPEPLALRYHGHQFRTYNPDIGDGRGFLFAQLRDAEDGRLLDLATKGSGRTPWSRQGDGRLTLKGGLREILATEMLEALGVETSKSFSLIETGESLYRGDEPSPTRSAVLVRLSHSHIRIGTFQRLAFLDDQAAIAKLVDYCVAQYFPELADAPAESRAADFLARVTARVARLGARYMAAGFVHGVLNSDNINVTGESFDYGPWRFAPRYDPQFTAAYFDDSGLYAFGRQPGALGWNLTRLAETVLPLVGLQRSQAILGEFQPIIQREFQLALLDRFGLAPAAEAEAEAALAKGLLEFLGKTQAGFEQTFFDWRGGLASRERAARSPQAALYDAPEFGPLREALAAHETAPAANLDHAYFRRDTPCTMLIEEVEAIWTPIAAADDWSALDAKLVDIAAMREAYGQGAA